LESTSRLLGEIFQEQGVHRSLQADMQLSDLAFGKRYDLHVSEARTIPRRIAPETARSL
jgi:hypothetical protein